MTRCKGCGLTYSAREEIAAEVMYICRCGRKVYFRLPRRVSVTGLLLRVFGGIVILGLLAGVTWLAGYAVSDFEGFQAGAGRLGRWLAERVGSPPGPPASRSREDAVLWRVTTRQGDTIQGEPLLETVRVESPFGLLVIPKGDVRWVVPGLHTPMAVRRQVADLIDNLAGSLQEVRAASEALLEIGADAVPQLREAEAGRELGVATAAGNLAGRILDRIGQEPIEDDHLATRYFPVCGRIRDPLALKTDLGRIPVAWSEVRRVDRVELAEIPWTVPPPPPAAGRSDATEPPEMVIESRDGNKLTGRLQTPVLRVATPYGLLRVPGERLTAVEILDAGSVQAAERAGLDLISAPDAAARAAVIKRLAELGPLGASMLQRAAASREPSVAEAAREHLAELDAQGQSYPAGPHRLATADWSFGGTILNTSLVFRSPSASEAGAGDLTIPLAVLRRMTVHQ